MVLLKVFLETVTEKDVMAVKCTVINTSIYVTWLLNYGY